MVFLAFLVALLSAPGAFAVSRCDALKAEADDLALANPVACDEARDTHAAFVKAFPEIVEACRKLETVVNAGMPPPGTASESELQMQAMEAKQRHITERGEMTDHLTRDLLPTPLDTGDPTRLAAQVSSECGTEIENHVRFRRQALQAFNELYGKIDAIDELLFQQAAERALPAAQSAVKNVR